MLGRQSIIRASVRGWAQTGLAPTSAARRSTKPIGEMSKRFHDRSAQPVRDRRAQPIPQIGEHVDGEECDGGEIYLPAAE